MKIRHKVPTYSRASDEITPEYQAEVDATMARAEAAWRRAERRLRKSEARLVKAREGKARAHTIAQLEAVVELRRVELEQLHRLMVATGAPATSRGRQSHRHVNTGGVL